jgi:hypothetical protein
VRSGREFRPVADYALSSEAEIHKGIEHHLTQIAHLKRLLNERACLWNRLPTEILARVFFFCRPPGWGIADQNLRSFMRRTHVCSRWRTVAIHTPELWAVGPCWAPNRTAKVLERAKEALLEVQYWASSSYMRDERSRDLLDLLRRLDRVRHIDLECHNFPVVEKGSALVNALYKPAPALEHLRIVGLGSNSGSTDFRIDSGQLFGQQAPKLRHLCLESCTFVPSDILRFSSLQTLRLKQLQSLSLGCLMRSLGELPALQDIELQDAIEGTDNERWTDRTPIQLPSLRSLVVEGSMAVVLCLAKHLLAVQLCQIDFTCMQLGSNDLIELLSSGLIPDGILRFRDGLVSASITSYDRTHSFAVSSSLRPASRWAHETIPSVSFIIKANDIAPLLFGTTDAFRSMLSLLGPLRLHALTISSDYSEYDSRTTDNTMWLHTFPAPYDSLRELCLSGSISAGLMNALGHHQGGLPKRPRKSTRAKQPDRAPCFFFGGLQELWLRDVDMRKVTTGASTLREIFLKHLKLRAMAKLPLRKLEIDQCRGFSEDDESRIQAGKWAQDLLWDGIRV